MLQSGNALLMVIAVFLAVAGAVIAILMVREIIEIGRSVYMNIRDELRYSRSNIATPERQVTPFRDRKTVERVIDYLEDEDKK
jgi:hypothetical protein